MKNPESANFFHSAPVQIRFNDIDKLGHVTNSVYQQYFDIGKMAYFNQVLEEQMDWEEEGLILVSIAIDFINPVFQYDDIVVRSKVVQLGNKSLKMVQDIFDRTTGNICATSKSVMVGFSNNRGESIQVPEKWRNRIKAFEKDILFEV